MKNRLITGMFTVAVGILLIAVPQWIFPVCSSNMEFVDGVINPSVPMKCFWMGRSELGLGIVVILLGAMLCIFKCTGVRLGLSLALLNIALLAAALPSFLIGVCPSETMLCRAGTLPALQMLSAILFLAMSINIIYLLKIFPK